MSATPSPAITPSAPAEAQVATLFTNNWTDLRVAADYAGVEQGELEHAVAVGEVRGLTSHPDSLGEWMVPLGDVEAWLRRRELAQAVRA
jgi:hypothetical protein